MAKNFIPVVGSVEGGYHAWAKSPEFVEYASTGGAFSGAYHQRDVVGNSKKELDKLKKRLIKGERMSLSPMKAWDWWGKVGEASENAARMGVYLKDRAAGKTRFEAGFNAKDLLDFHMSGQSGVMQFLIQTVPFLNARIQGLYKVARTGGDTKNENFAKFWVAGTIMSMAAMALHFINDDQEWYKDLPQHEKLSYFHFKFGDTRFRLPVPFEVGSMFGVSPVSIYEWASGQKDGDQTFDLFYQMVRDIFAFNPIPQAIKPLWDQYANKDSFTGLPIDSRSDQSLEPALRYNERTSKLARGVGKAINVSPKRIDKLTKDYFSFFSLMTVAVTDMAAEWAIEYPEDPAVGIGDRYIIGNNRFVKTGVPTHIEAEKRFYDMLTGADMAKASAEYHRKSRDKEAFKAYRKENKGKLQSQKRLSKTQKSIRVLNNRIKLIKKSTKWNADEKREKIDKLLLRRHKLVRKSVDNMWEKYNKEGK